MKSKTFSEVSDSGSIDVEINEFLEDNPKIEFKCAISAGTKWRYYVTIFYYERVKK